MPLDRSKLENIRTVNGRTEAACPACREAGSDKTGNHFRTNRKGSDMDANELLDDKQVATDFHVSRGTLANWRSSRMGGPPFVKVGRLVRYRRRDLEEWLQRQTVRPGAGIG